MSVYMWNTYIVILFWQIPQKIMEEPESLSQGLADIQAELQSIQPNYLYL